MPFGIAVVADCLLEHYTFLANMMQAFLRMSSRCMTTLNRRGWPAKQLLHSCRPEAFDAVSGGACVRKPWLIVQERWRWL